MAVEINGRRAVFACRIEEVSEQQPFRAVFVDRPPIGVFKLDDGFVAIDDTCSHGQASLCEGLVEDGKAECPYHSAFFDLRTGEALTMPATEAVSAYPVVVEEGGIYNRG
jgi:nitrite reductase/ring-hydroxylating ferredoxin subunit